MTTTLSSAGGNSLVTDGTGPTLQIKGLADGIGTKVVSTSTTLAFRLKAVSEMQRFADDFYYHTNGTTVDINNSTSPFMKSNTWYAETVSGADICQIQQWPGGGPGVIKFNNNVRTGAGAWKLSAPNMPFSVGGGTELSFETAVYFDSPSSNAWIFNIGFISGAGVFMGFALDPTNSTYLKTAVPGSAGVTSVTAASMYGAWTLLKIIVDSTNSAVKFYVNGTLADTRGAATSTYYLPYIYTSRTGTITTLSYYVDYIEVIKDSR